ncbi:MULTISPECIES: site-specific integrase [Erysipelotrichaceae]|jgi:integrase|uniref:site-specific integrase n=2 Tax=Bacillota TaxID=1239 RepID=UPI000E408445|nr:site-specific integrase [Absiella sp. AM22-9]RGB58613.1 site-specific integrase [Absiella sp. AM22-9]
MAQKKDEKTGKWYYYGSYVDEFNKRIQYKKRGYNTKREAIRAEESFRMDVESHKIPTSNYTMSNLIDDFLDHYITQNKASSYQSNKQVYAKIKASIGHIKLSKLNATILQSYINDLDKKYSKRYVEKIYYCINKALNYGIDKNKIINNPLKKVYRDTRKNELKKEMNFWEPYQFQKFISRVDDKMYYTLFSFLYYMGCRKGEALALQWNDIDLNNSTVNIRKTVTFKVANNPWLITPPKTGNSIRIITMPSKLKNIMVEWKNIQKNIYGFDLTRYVFGFTRPLAPENVRRHFNDGITKANTNDDGTPINESDQIPKIRIHDLRHSHASYLINNKSDMFTDFDIAKRLGDTVQTLHETYAHWFHGADKNIIDFMDQDI